MKKILLVFTGGTIGSKTSGSAIDVREDAGYELLEKYKASGHGHEGIVFETIQPFTLLSENIVPQDWHILYKSIMRHKLSEYDGVIITHGSDTLAYTAAAVSYMFHQTNIPILLTASNYPLDHPKSEGVRNFAACVSMIQNDPLPGIFVVFEDDHGRTLVHLGTRLMQSQPFTDQFHSIYNAPYGEIREGRLHVFTNEVNPSIEQLQRGIAVEKQAAYADPAFTSNVLLLKPYPGFQYTYVNREQAAARPQAVIVELYHSGTTGIRAVSPEGQLSSFAKWCHDHDIGLYAAPIKDVSGSLYTSSHEMLALGITPLEGISIEAALVKLMLAYGSFHDKQAIEQFVQQNLFYEFVFTI